MDLDLNRVAAVVDQENDRVLPEPHGGRDVLRRDLQRRNAMTLADRMMGIERKADRSVQPSVFAAYQPWQQYRV